MVGSDNMDIVSIINFYKNNISNYLNLFHQKFPNIDISSRNELIEKLEIKSKNMKNKMEYNIKENTIYINSNILIVDEHSFVHELIHMLSSNGKNITGIAEKGFIQLNEGITEFLTNYLIINTTDNFSYINETIVANLFISIMGEKLLNYYFNNDTLGFVTDIINYVDSNKLIELLNEMNVNYMDISKNSENFKNIINKFNEMIYTSKFDLKQMNNYNNILNQYIKLLKQYHYINEDNDFTLNSKVK